MALDYEMVAFCNKCYGSLSGHLYVVFKWFSVVAQVFLVFYSWLLDDFYWPRSKESQVLILVCKYDSFNVFQQIVSVCHCVSLYILC